MKTRYNISLFEGANTLAKDMAIIACLSNGGSKTPFKFFEHYFDHECIKYPVLTEGMDLTISENSLLVDKTYSINGELNTIYMLEIQEVEIVELAGQEESTNNYINEINYQRPMNPPDDISDVL